MEHHRLSALLERRWSFFVSASATHLASGVVVGQDLGYWTTALRFAGSLVARQQYYLV